MEFGYSSSASSSPDPQAFVLPLIYDTTPESSTPPSPDELQRMFFFTPMPSYDMPQYQSKPTSTSTSTSTSTLTSTYDTSSTNSQHSYEDPTKEDLHDRRRKRIGKPSKEKGNTTTMHLRRRAQNRASQRAFRERKEKHVKSLEAQLSDLHDKHQGLLQSYSRQSEEVAKLHNRIAEMTAELNDSTPRSSSSFGDLILPDKFDAVPAPAMLYSGPDFYFDKGVLEMEPNETHDNDLL